MTLSAEPGDRILIVEDDDDIRESLAELLEEHGYDVTTARDGVEAVESVDLSAPTMVISDVRMPRRDGYELVHELRDRVDTADMPIVLVSASSERRQRVDGLDRGADDYMSKPIDPEELLARVRVHLRHAHRRQELERRTLIDPLTGVLNRRGLMEVLRHEHQRVARVPGTPLSILMIDVDRFKALNDNHGHQAGDQVLRHIAAKLAETVRAVDHVGRLGGDEFVVVTPDGTEAAASRLAERLAEMRLPPLELGGNPLSVEVSIGVATLQPAETVDELLARADLEMYDRKRKKSALRGKQARIA